jgi:hypothetical protein
MTKKYFPSVSDFERSGSLPHSTVSPRYVFVFYRDLPNFLAFDLRA